MEEVLIRGVRRLGISVWKMHMQHDPSQFIYSVPTEVIISPRASLEAQAGKESACNSGNLDSIPGLERSPGEGKRYPLQYSGLENSVDCLVHGVTKSQTWLSDIHFHISTKSKWFSSVVVQFSSVQSCPTLCDPMNCSTPGFPVHHQLQEFTQTHVHWVGDVIQPSHPLSSPSSTVLNPSIRVFSNQSALCIRWPKYWSFSFSISPSNEYSGLISFSMDWLDLLAVQGALKSLLKHHSSKASILRSSPFFIVQHSHPYMTAG